jgi:hypothetical protein
VGPIPRRCHHRFVPHCDGIRYIQIKPS